MIKHKIKIRLYQIMKKMIRVSSSVNSLDPTVKNTKANGKTTNFMDTANSLTLMVLTMKVSSKMS